MVSGKRGRVHKKAASPADGSFSVSCPLPVSAQSLFAGLVPTAQPTEELPDYGAWANADVVLRIDNEDASSFVYLDVTQEIFEEFGVYLNELGYAITDTLQEEESLYATLQKDDLYFQIQYSV